MKTILLVVLSTGWLVPVYLSVSTYLQWIALEILPRAKGEAPLNSFPFPVFSRQMLALGLSWLAVAIAVWVVLVVRRPNA